MSSKTIYGVIALLALTIISGGVVLLQKSKTQVVQVSPPPVSIATSSPVAVAPKATSTPAAETPDLHNHLKVIVPPKSNKSLISESDVLTDTTDWSFVESKLSGYRMKVPTGSSDVGCFGHGCDPLIYGDGFYYSITGWDQTPGSGNWEGPDIGLVGLTIVVGQKASTSSLDTFAKDLLLDGTDYIASQPRRGMIAGRDALMFDVNKVANHEISSYVATTINYLPFPNGEILNIGPGIGVLSNGTVRYIIIDAKNRYIIIAHSVKINSAAFKEFDALQTGREYDPLLEKKYPDDKLLKIYNTMLTSLELFTPVLPPPVVTAPLTSPVVIEPCHSTATTTVWTKNTPYPMPCPTPTPTPPTPSR